MEKVKMFFEQKELYLPHQNEIENTSTKNNCVEEQQVEACSL